MIRDIGPAPRLIDAICPSRRGYFIGMIFLVLSFFFWHPLRNPLLYGSGRGISIPQRRPSFCSATALRFTRVLFFSFFFFSAFVSEIEILSIRFTRPGISTYLYHGGNAYLLYRVTEDIVPKSVLHLQARAE